MSKEREALERVISNISVLLKNTSNEIGVSFDDVYEKVRTSDHIQTISTALTELEQIKARAEETIGVVAKYGTSLLSTIPMTPILFVNTINYIINGDSKC